MIKYVLLVAADKREVSERLLSRYQGNLFLTGIGPTQSAVALTRYLLKDYPFPLDKTLVINFGTVGSGEFKVGTVLSVKSLTLSGDSFVRKEIIPDEIPVIETTSNSQIPQVKLCTSTKFINRYMPYDEFVEYTARYEAFDMEGAALAYAAHTLGAKFSSIKIVSDNLRSTPKDWEKVLDGLREPLADAVEKFITSLNLG